MLFGPVERGGREVRWSAPQDFEFSDYWMVVDGTARRSFARSTLTRLDGLGKSSARPSGSRPDRARRVSTVGLDLLHEFGVTQQRRLVRRHHHRRREHQRPVGMLGDQVAVVPGVAEASESDPSSSIEFHEL